MTNRDTMNHRKSRDSQPFRAPEGYLETLPERIMACIDAGHVIKAAPKRPSRARIINMYMRYATGVAAAIVFFIMFVQSNVAQMEDAEQTTQTETRLASVSDQVYDYLLLDDQMIYDYDDVEE